MALDKQLENILKGYSGSKARENYFEGLFDPTDFAARQQRRDPQGNLMLTDDQFSYMFEKQEREQIDQTFKTELEAKGGYNKNIKPLFDELSDNAKINYYLRLAQEGVVPKDASKELKAVVNLLQKTELLEKYIAKGDVQKISQFIQQYGIEDPMVLVSSSYFNRNGNTSGLVNVAQDMVRTNQNKAYEVLKKEKGLQAELSKGLVETEAYALSGSTVINLYNAEPEVKYRKDLAAKAA